MKKGSGRQEIGKRSCGHECQKRLENGFVVFLERSDNASDAEKEAGKFLGSKVSRNFLTEFGHPDSPLVFIVGEGDLGVGHEEENRRAVFMEPSKKGLGDCSFFLPVRTPGCCSIPLSTRLRKCSRIASPSPSLILSRAPDTFRFWRDSRKSRTGKAHVSSGKLSMMPLSSLEYMGIAEAVRTGVIEVGREEVGDEGSGKLRKDADLGCGSCPALFVKPQKLRLRVGGNVNPLKFPLDSQAGLVGMQEAGGSERGFDRFQERGGFL